MKSLQDKYNLIKEGKGSKELFIKEARTLFPNVVTGALTFDQSIHNLTERGIISEGMTGVLIQKEGEPNWFKIFNENTEAVKATLKDTDKSVKEKEIAGYDYEDKKNNNNISTAEILKGYYAEMKDPKNADKTEEELKKIVFKNLEKDPMYYIKDGEFGIKGIGYTEDAPGLGKTKEVTGKYKSSGMEPVKLNESMGKDNFEKYVVYTFIDGKPDEKELYQDNMTLRSAKGTAFTYNMDDSPEVFNYMKQSDWEAQYGPTRVKEDKVPGSNIKKVGDKWRILSGKTGKMWKAHYDTKEDAEKGLKAYFASQHESKDKMTSKETLSEAKKRAIEKHLKEIEKLGEVAAYEYKANKIQEKIEELKNKLTMTESDDVKEMVDKNAIKEIKKDIAVLEKRKKMYEAQKAKAAKRVSGDTVRPKAAGGEEIIDEAKEKTPMWQQTMKSVLKKKGY
jgi:hypothetical protein